jgi:hypothetical protein
MVLATLSSMCVNDLQINAPWQKTQGLLVKWRSEVKESFAGHGRDHRNNGHWALTRLQRGPAGAPRPNWLLAVMGFGLANSPLRAEAV